ncbi:methionyl-tRNA formyltransferase [Salinibacter ruber]|uniref:methionyl-tRNA formyltransferase n=1 Tax=Salinibacter ruber TaxID=146919 RepID=UPI002169F605|nr:methionyl-tRNA formyltransferase [Salinibacter ruber]MCS3648571.1 methionyl-tRNA formyltransferase [Salinibacter ruber]
MNIKNLRIGYVGSTKVTKKILEKSSVSPEIVISFDESHEDKISGFARYPDYGENWFTVKSINSKSSYNIIKSNSLDVLLVMGWQELLEPKILSIPKMGCIGRHLSLLPKRRGRAPVAWALIHGLKETGVTLFWMDEGVDSGDIALQKRVNINHEDEASDIHEKMTNISAEMMDNIIAKISSGEIPRKSQNEEEATYTHPRRPDMGLVDWTRSAAYLYNFIRGQTKPYPGAFTYHKMDRIRIWHASIEDSTKIVERPGSVLSVKSRTENIIVQAGEGILSLTIENEAGEFPINSGSVLGSPR